MYFICCDNPCSLKKRRKMKKAIMITLVVVLVLEVRPMNVQA